MAAALGDACGIGLATKFRGASATVVPPLGFGAPAGPTPLTVSTEGVNSAIGLGTEAPFTRTNQCGRFGSLVTANGTALAGANGTGVAVAVAVAVGGTGVAVALAVAVTVGNTSNRSLDEPQPAAPDNPAAITSSISSTDVPAGQFLSSMVNPCDIDSHSPNYFSAITDMQNVGYSCSRFSSYISCRPSSGNRGWQEVWRNGAGAAR
ncbi:MAG: hypothetical protein ACLQU2_21665 [Candidatus Binataceae bacterium]